MSQSNLKHVFSKLKVNVGPRRRFRNPLGPEGRLLKMRKTVTALLKHERIELNYHRGDESRGYAERLISDAIKYGELHKETMEMASYWLLEKQLVHKLFKVLVPRYQDCKYSFTRMFRAPREYPGSGREKCILELRGNIYPDIIKDKSVNGNLLHNILLEEMRKECMAGKNGSGLFRGSNEKTLKEIIYGEKCQQSLDETSNECETNEEKCIEIVLEDQKDKQVNANSNKVNEESRT